MRSASGATNRSTFCLIHCYMSQTDRQTDKSSRWQFTAYEDQWDLFEDIERTGLIKFWKWQTEIAPTTGRKHYQGCMQTVRQVRMSQLVKAFPKVHIEVARDWNALLKYCGKDDTAIQGTQVEQKSDRAYLNMHSCFILLGREYAACRDEYEECLRHYLTTHDVKDAAVYEYKWLSRRLVEKEPRDVAIYSNPQFQRAWVDYGMTFRRLGLAELEAPVPDSITREPSESDQEDDGDVMNEFISPADV